MDVARLVEWLSSMYKVLGCITVALALRTERQVILCDLGASMVYITSSRLSSEIRSHPRLCIELKGGPASRRTSGLKMVVSG